MVFFIIRIFFLDELTAKYVQKFNYADLLYRMYTRCFLSMTIVRFSSFILPILLAEKAEFIFLIER